MMNLQLNFCNRSINEQTIRMTPEPKVFDLVCARPKEHCETNLHDSFYTAPEIQRLGPGNFEYDGAVITFKFHPIKSLDLVV